MIDYAACRGSRNAQKLGIGYNTIHNLRLPATAVFFERLPPSANILDRLGRKEWTDLHGDRVRRVTRKVETSEAMVGGDLHAYTVVSMSL